MEVLASLIVKEVISRVLAYFFRRQPDRKADDNVEATLLSLESQLEQMRREERERGELLRIRMIKHERMMGELKIEIENSRLVAENEELRRRKFVAQTAQLEVLRLKNLGATREAIRKKLGIDNVKKFNYAITGHTGVGKSTFLNALLGLDPKSQESAATDVVECTKRPTAYGHPKSKNLFFWDLPGAGTRDHPVETYYEDNALHAFDAIFIITGDRILSIDLDIARQSKKFNKPIVIVRSKADLIRDSAVEDGITMAEAAAIFRKKVCENFQQELGKAGLSDINLLIVSSRAFIPNKSPYTLGRDTSLEAMDEKLVLKFLLETAAARYNSTEQLENLRLLFGT